MNFRKNVAMLAMTLCAMTATAQTETGAASADDARTFVPHWTLQVQGGVGHTRGEASFGDLISPAIAVNAGYRFTPVVGIRFGGSGFQARGGWVSPSNIYVYKYAQGNVDVTFDMSALFCKYNPQRVFNVYTFLGAGINAAFDNDEALTLARQGYDLRYAWVGHRFSPAGRLGLGADFRVARRVSINIEANANVLSDHFNSKKAGNADWQFNFLAGLSFRLGKLEKKAAPAAVVVEEPVAVAPVPQPEPEPAPVVVETIEEKPAAFSREVFFLINSSKVRQSEQGKIAELVEFLNANPEAKVVLTGHADAATGTPAINSRLANERAKAVAVALSVKGIKANRITVVNKGDTEQPHDTPAECRVTICVAE